MEIFPSPNLPYVCKHTHVTDIFLYVRYFLSYPTVSYRTREIVRKSDGMIPMEKEGMSVKSLYLADANTSLDVYF